MNEREELNDIFLDWYQTHFPGMGLVVGSALDDLKDRILAPGFRKTLDDSPAGFVLSASQIAHLWNKAKEHERDEYATDLGETVAFMKLSQVRRLAAPKERWVAVTEPFEKRMRYNTWDGTIVLDCYFGYGPLTGNPEKQDIKPEVECWRETGSDKPCRYPILSIQPIPSPPPTTPAQTAKEGV